MLVDPFGDAVHSHGSDPSAEFAEGISGVETSTAWTTFREYLAYSMYNEWTSSHH